MQLAACHLTALLYLLLLAAQLCLLFWLRGLFLWLLV
jgi:hypothetical protein